MAQDAHLRKATAAARVAREELGLGLDQPVHDLLTVVEEAAGVPVAVLALGQGVAGAYMVRRDRAFIFVNGSEAVTRQRFTLAHELGHHRLGHGAVVDGTKTVGGSTKDPVEREANAFASELLAPDRALRSWMAAHGDPAIDLAVVVRVSSWFGISPVAGYWRLCNAGILTRHKLRSELRQALDRGQHRGVEQALAIAAVEDSLARIKREGLLPRLPAQLRDNALTAYAAGLIDLDRLAAALRRDRATVERMVGELGIAPSEPEPDW